MNEDDYMVNQETDYDDNYPADEDYGFSVSDEDFDDDYDDDDDFEDDDDYEDDDYDDEDYDDDDEDWDEDEDY